MTVRRTKQAEAILELRLALVDAGVLEDDTPDIVRTVTFHAPVVDRERHSDALTLWISEYLPAWWPEKEPF